MALLIKAGVWPMSFWLSTTYMAGVAPVAAMFAIMTKVGVYVILRLSLLLFGAGGGASAGFGSEVLIAGGVATVAFGILGVLASQSVGRMAAHLVLISSGTLLAVTGFVLAGAGTAMLAGALYYLVSSTLATSALFLLIEPMGREEGGIAAMLALTADAYGLDDVEDDGTPEVGFAIPGTLTILGLSFGACLLVLAGLPPLSGFIGKFAILAGALGQESVPPAVVWGFMALMLLSGLATLIGMIRIGIRTFWATDSATPKVLALEIAPVILLVGMILLLTFQAQHSIRYMEKTARGLLNPASYVVGVMTAPSMADQQEDTE
jgi:multicomponent K+:H+ antiporter subunit D